MKHSLGWQVCLKVPIILSLLSMKLCPTSQIYFFSCQIQDTKSQSSFKDEFSLSLLLGINSHLKDNLGSLSDDAQIEAVMINLDSLESYVMGINLSYEDNFRFSLFLG